MLRFALVLALGGLLAGAAGVGAYVWWRLDDVDMGFHGAFALVLAVVLGLGLWVGLMSLVFYSSRRGHDDRAGRP
jgi:hypothetical protein